VSTQTAPRRTAAILNRLGSLLGLVVLCAALAAFNEQFRSFTNYLLLCSKPRRLPSSPSVRRS